MNQPALDACEREALHLSGAIQPHGVLLVLTRQLRISHLSANGLPPWCPGVALGLAPPAPLQQAAGELGSAPGTRCVLPALQLAPGRRVDAVLTRSVAGTVVVELLAPGAAAAPLPLQPPLHALHDDTHQAAALKRWLVQAVADATQAHRVLFYAFQPDGDGIVEAEACTPAFDQPYLGLRFPAGDIPHIARQLYLRNPWRHIPDALAAPLPVQASPLADAVPDLTWSDLRSVSPMHLAYMGHMGVRGAVSFPVALGNELTALVSCHHREPLPLSVSQLSAVAALVRRVSLDLNKLRVERRMHTVQRLERGFIGVRDAWAGVAEDGRGWPAVADWLLALFDADGVALVDDRRCLQHGQGFDPQALQALDTWFRAVDDPLHIDDCVSQRLPGWLDASVAGVVALHSTRGQHRLPFRLYLARHPQLQDVAWGGQPDHDPQAPPSPRRSFARWVQRRSDHGRPWSAETRLQALCLRRLMRPDLT